MRGIINQAEWENKSVKPSTSTIADNVRDKGWYRLVERGCVYIASFSLALATSLIALISQPGTSHSEFKIPTSPPMHNSAVTCSFLSKDRQVSDESKLGSS